jgi:hypothetical protein
MRAPIGAPGLDRHLAQAAERPLLSDHALGEGDGFGQEIALDDRIDDTELQGLRRAHGIAGDDHLESGLEARDARQALDAAGAGDDADLDLGQAHLSARRGDPEVAAERHLEPAAERHAVDRRDHRLRARLQCRDGDTEARGLWRLAELADVGACDEGLALADHDDCGNAGIGDGALDAVDHALPYRDAERVHRRVVDRENGDGALLGIGDGHANLPLAVAWLAGRARHPASGCGLDAR